MDSHVVVREIEEFEVILSLSFISSFILYRLFLIKISLSLEYLSFCVFFVHLFFFLTILLYLKFYVILQILYLFNCVIKGLVEKRIKTSFCCFQCHSINEKNVIDIEQHKNHINRICNFFNQQKIYIYINKETLQKVDPSSLYIMIKFFAI